MKANQESIKDILEILCEAYGVQVTRDQEIGVMREIQIKKFEHDWGIEMVGVADDGRVYTLVRRACKDRDEEDRLWGAIVRNVGMIEQGLRSGEL